MRPTFLFSFASLILSVAAYERVATFERLWFWYAYQLDDNRNTIAPNCAKAMGIGAARRCNFVQFMEYIDLGKGAKVDPSKIQNVDPSNIPAASKALSDGRYTGQYDCTYVYEGLRGGAGGKSAQSNVPALFRALGEFCSGKIGQQSDAVQTNMRAITTAILRTRQDTMARVYQKQLAGKDPPVKRALTDVDLYDNVPVGNTYLEVKGVDWPQSMSDSSMTEGQLRSAMKQYSLTEREGHTANVAAIQLARTSVSKACGRA